MKPYLSLFRMSAQRMMAYRVNTLLGWLGGAAYLVTALALWRVLLQDGPVGGYDWSSMKAYLLVGWATGALGSAYGDWTMADRILEGNVALDLTKPIDYQLARFFEQAGGLVIELGAIAVAALAVVGLGGGILPPRQVGLFVVSFLLVVPLKFLLSYLVCMLCFWTQNFMGVSWAKMALINLFSGSLVPLSMLPGWLGSLAVVLPFAGITATPAAIYLGQSTGAEAVGLIAVQVAWILALWALSRVLWRGALRALTVHGG